MKEQLYIIEARREDGELALDVPQPETFFGPGAYLGMSTDQMAKSIYGKVPDAVLTGNTIPIWPKFVHATWIARRKTW